MTRQQSAAYARACNICKEVGLQNPGRPEPVKQETRIPLTPFNATKRPGDVIIRESDLKAMYDIAQANYEQAHARLMSAMDFDRFNQFSYWTAKEEADKAEKALARHLLKSGRCVYSAIKERASRTA